LKNVLLMSQDGWTALHWASHKAHIKILQTLLANGADPSIKRNVSTTSLCNRA
jgi:ankyrin repeat protein